MPRETSAHGPGKSCQTATLCFSFHFKAVALLLRALPHFVMRVPAAGRCRGFVCPVSLQGPCRQTQAGVQHACVPWSSVEAELPKLLGLRCVFRVFPLLSQQNAEVVFKGWKDAGKAVIRGNHMSSQAFGNIRSCQP